MSYDISIDKKEVKEVNTNLLDLNYTYNVSPMFRKALGGNGINDLHGKLCKDCVEKLSLALFDMGLNRSDYEILNPKNNWGNYQEAFEVLKTIYSVCLLNPEATITIN